MKIKNRFVLVLIIAGSLVIAVLAGIVLVRWTNAISSKQRVQELRTALKSVLDTYGEKGLLEMAGVPVDNIYYGESGVSLFLGDQAAWTYSNDELQNISIFEASNRAVVHIETQVTDDSSYFDAVPESDTGSGFFISADGLIVTNYHVIKDASIITVSLYDGSVYEAQLIGSDDENDIAVIKISPTSDAKISILSFGDSDSLLVGQKVIAIGNPFGYDRTMVTGIISGLSRPIRDEAGRVMLGMVQTSAPINPGNSGGPLLNTKGQVIGINTSIYSTSGTSQGMNFAVASNTAAASVNDIVNYGRVSRGWLDIVPVQLSQSIVDYAGLKVSKGLLVSQIVPGGLADQAGLKAGTQQVRYGNSVIYLGGDIITEINGISISDYNDLFSALSNTKPGDSVQVMVYRSGNTVRLNITLVERTEENLSWINR
ncbi:MAG: trypsin-like peptidase domain-containing protein [Spirochaetales bacterium]|jgi:S1-C subfamily serine protease|nr:trypsin-like peptidase domain-containing protein [Spirochaetales bacterium]MBQ4281133.1 trypsin-like peptidase domain-containing protein [Spirochaetales bacterium]MBQ5391816.1 trypsin-like peptidase domain-containing protein [Spirochaetales bacterium]MBR4477135.1 trypsin-like peptidase domain-containing protein [Spirochaetales bacterium]MBR6234600.1 trypsin-like peptidase domain-containing protein [Spirochaetales bacterium]